MTRTKYPTTIINKTGIVKTYACGCRAKKYNERQYLYRWTICKKHHQQLVAMRNIDAGK